MEQYTKSKNFLTIALASSLAFTFFLSCQDNMSVSDTYSQQNNPKITSYDQNLEVSQNNEDPQIIEGEYIVIFEEQWNREISEQVARQADQLREQIIVAHSIAEDSVLNRYNYVSKGFAAILSDEQVEYLQNDPRISSVSPNALLGLANHSVARPQDETTKQVRKKSARFLPNQSSNWGTTRVGGFMNGDGMTAWILDTGIDLTHPDLNVDTANSASFIAGESANDGNGHGTHVAGIIASTGQNTNVRGVASGATVVAVKVCFDEQPGPNQGQCPVNSIMAGIQYVAMNALPQDIVNMSIGGYDPNQQYIGIDNAVIDAADDGIRFAIAAGNNSLNAANFTPARVIHQNTWTVSAFRQGDEFVQTFDWNTPNCNPGQNPNLGSNFGNPPIRYSAPGENILSLWRNGGTRITCGTSMAAPHVAGLLLALGNEPVVNGYVSNDPSSPPAPIASSRPARPLITASVQDHRPRLEWQAIEGADSYDIYRDVGYDPILFFANTTDTHYVDFTTYSEELTVVPSPTGQYINVSYQIRAVPDAAQVSDKSNIVHFDMGDCSFQPCAHSAPPEIQ